MTTPDGPRSVPVHIASASEGVFPGSQDKRRHIQSVFRTFVLAAPVAGVAQPLPVLAEDRSRVAAWMVAYGNSVILCSSQSQAQDPANQAANAAAGAAFANTPGNPQGTLLFVPVLIGPPVNSNPSVRWTLNTTEIVWAVSMGPAMLAVTIENRAAGY
jgi:hypothetical protein